MKLRNDCPDPHGIDFNDYWVRVDCDNPVYQKGWLNYVSLKYGWKIPFIHNRPVWDAKKLLDEYDVPRIWFFRPYTVPNDSWNEPYGLHATYKEPHRFYWELKVIEEKMGVVNYFTRHGFSPLKSGTIWTPQEVLTIEEIFGLTDLTTLYHHTLNRGVEYQGQKCILLHPSQLRQSETELRKILKENGY
jgi:hypothetical protein